MKKTVNHSFFIIEEVDTNIYKVKEETKDSKTTY